MFVGNLRPNKRNILNEVIKQELNNESNKCL